MSTQATPSFCVPSHSGTLEVHLLGMADFDALHGLQDYLTYEISGRQNCDGRLFLCEHPPLISVGREARSSDILIDDVERERIGVPLRWVSRGGGAYGHGPGQLAIYPMLPLSQLRMSLPAFRAATETAICQTCHELKIPAKRFAESAGVWGRGGQLAFFGASVQSWISRFGIYLNVSILSDLMTLTRPNALQRPPTSIQAHRIEPLSMPALRESLIRHLSESFGYHSTDVSTGHPLLKKQIQKVGTYV